MGADTSVPLGPVKPGFSTMCITFQNTDRITVLHLDDAGLSVIRQAIRDTWLSGISIEQSVCGSGWSFKLCGNPFSCAAGSDTSKQARQMVGKIIQKLCGIGWKINATTNLGRQNDKGTLFFKKSAPEFSTVPYVCIGLSNTDKLQIINLPSQLEEPLKETIRCSWSLGIQNESKSMDGILEIKLSGNPWRATDQQSVMAKVLLQNIISTLHCYQWAYSCNVNLKSTADSLFFCYDPNIPAGNSPPFCTISLNRHDRLRVINAPVDIIAVIRKVIEMTWLPGVIQQEKDYYGSWEFKLSGNPWHSTSEESIKARYLVLKILEAMQEQGWLNIAGIDISRRDTDKSVLIFQKCQPKHCPLMCLSLNDTDKFRLINMPPQLMELFKCTLLSRWPKGIQAEKELSLSFGSVSQMKLFGLPWTGGLKSDTLHAQSFLCNIIEEFRLCGWNILLCADVSAKYDDDDEHPIDVHSIWFVYDTSASVEQSPPSYGFNFASVPGHYGMSPSPYPGVSPSPYPPASAASVSGQYGVPPSTYPPASAPPMPAYGVPPASYPQPNEPPPTYGQATGWNEFGGKK